MSLRRPERDAAKAELAKREEQLGELSEQHASERRTNQETDRVLNTAADETKAKLSEVEEKVADLANQLEFAWAQVEQLARERDAAQSELKRN